MTRRVAVLIGSSRFPREPALTSLDAPERDVDAFRDVLAADKGGVFDEVAVLKNQPTQDVRLLVNKTLRNAGKDDQVLLYFSGHGKLDPTGRLCLTMTDTVLDALESSALRVAELKDFLDVSRCKNVMLFLDCCYSGAVGKSFTRSAVDDQLQIAAQGGGICIMSASNAVQTAMETPEAGLGVFTRCVIEGIRTGAADVDGDGLVTFDELYDYVHQRVAAEGHQRPQKWSFQAEGDLLVARTGRDRWEETKDRLRARILALQSSQDLPDEVADAARAVLKVPRREQTEMQRTQISLIEELAGERGKPAAFAIAWIQLRAAVPPPPPPPPPPPAPPVAAPEERTPPPTAPTDRVDPVAPEKPNPWLRKVFGVVGVASFVVAVEVAWLGIALEMRPWDRRSSEMSSANTLATMSTAPLLAVAAVTFAIAAKRRRRGRGAAICGCVIATVVALWACMLSSHISINEVWMAFSPALVTTGVLARRWRRPAADTTPPAAPAG